MSILRPDKVLKYILDDERRQELLAKKKPKPEEPRNSRPKTPPTKDKLDLMADYVEKRYDTISLGCLTQEWNEEGTRVRLLDPEEGIVAILDWRSGKMEIEEFITCYLMKMQNKRLPYSCAVAERDTDLDDGSPTGKLMAARSEVGGILSTN
jgi:hypothetical protein